MVDYDRGCLQPRSRGLIAFIIWFIVYYTPSELIYSSFDFYRKFDQIILFRKLEKTKKYYGFIYYQIHFTYNLLFLFFIIF
jgi:hypothetical protein